MTRKYTNVKQFEQTVLKMKAEGMSHAEIAESLNLSKDQIKELVKRLHKQERESGITIPAKRKGRPRINSIDSWKVLEAENARLKMENELLRDFLSATERE
jgi:orotate phosphoribosyltransferase-like protein